MTKFNCNQCNKDFNSLKSLQTHNSRIHKISGAQTYVNFNLNGEWPLCKCGCTEKLNFQGGKFGDYIRGHAAKINGGFYKFKSGSLKCIWDDFVKNVEFWQLNYYRKGIVHTKYYGEQNYVNWKIQEHKIKLTLTPEKWLCKYTDDFNKNLQLNKTYSEKFDTDYMILDDVHKYIKVVHFTGVGKTIHDCKEKFIEDNWK